MRSRHRRQTLLPWLLAATAFGWAEGAPGTELGLGPSQDLGRYRVVGCPVTPAMPPGVRLECGRLAVPENRGAASTRAIELAVFRLWRPPHAGDRGRRFRPTLLWLQGGPGEAASVDLETWAGSELLRTRDVVLFDQRGTGFSTPALSCPELRAVRLPHFTQPSAREGELVAARSAAAACAARWRAQGVDLDGYHSVETAADVRDLRRALGLRRWDVYGVSYGTRAALMSMRMPDAGIDSVLLDSGSPPDLSVGLSVAIADGERALARFFQRCTESADCAAEVPDLAGAFETMVARFNDQPFTVGVVLDGEPQQLVFNGDDLGLLSWLLLKDSSALQQLPVWIAALAQGDTTVIEEVFVPVTVDGLLAAKGEFSLTQWAVDCADLGRLLTPADEELNQRPGRWGGARLFSSGPYCSTIGVQPLAAELNEPVVSALPTLLLAGELDPVSLPERTRQAGAGLKRALYVEVPAAGHVPGMGTGCGESIVRRFLKAPGSLFGNPEAVCTEEDGLRP